MSFNLGKLFIEWRRIVPNGVPNPSNDYHLVLLKEVCLANGIDVDTTNNVILALEKKDDDKYTSVGRGYYKLDKDIGPDGKGKEGTPRLQKMIMVNMLRLAMTMIVIKKKKKKNQNQLSIFLPIHILKKVFQVIKIMISIVKKRKKNQRDRP